MIKARHHILRLTDTQPDRLKQLQQEAARCWNDILAIAKAHYADGNGWISKGDLQKRLKGQYRLHSQTVQGLTDRFCSNRKTAAANRRLGLATNDPWRTKEFVSVPFKQMAIRKSTSGTLELTLCAGERFDTGVAYPENVNTCDLLWRSGRFVLSITTDHADIPPVVSGTVAGADLGEIHPVALCTETGEGLVVSGREIRSIKRRRNKELGKLARALSRCTKGSRRWKKLRRARGKLRTKTDQQVKNLIHQATRKAIDWCQDHAVKELVIGNPAGVEQNTKKHKRLKRKSRQKVSQMETGRIKHYLNYKATEVGIATCLVGERGTSRDCPVCGRANRPSGRNYRCRCGFVSHRDGKAAFMMIRQQHPSTRLPKHFRFEHRQAIPTYRKRPTPRPACVVGSDVTQSCLVIAEPLPDALSIEYVGCSQEESHDL